MRKTFFAIVMLMTVGQLPAQESKYIRVDTLYRPYWQFDWRSWIDTDNTHPLSTEWALFSLPYRDSLDPLNWTRPWVVWGDILQYNYVDEPTDVYGISIWRTLFTESHFGHFSFDRPEYLYLYETTTDSSYMLEQIPFDYTGEATRCDTFPLHQSYSQEDTCGDMMSTAFSQVCYRYDFYFEKPVRVQDSFYVGFSQDWFRPSPDNPLPASDLRPYQTVMTTSWTSSQTGATDQYYSPDSSCWIRNKMKVFWKPNDYDTSYYYGLTPSSYNLRPYAWSDIEVPEFFLVLPIFREYDTVWTVDTPACAPVLSFGLMSRYGNTVRLRWTHDGVHDEWEVSYGPQGTGPEEGRRATCHTHTWTYEDTLGVAMVAYVRTVCRELDTVRYSEWSEGVEWRPRQRVAEAEGCGLRLVPNPASEWVEVETSGEVERIEVYDMGGARRRELPRGTSGFSVRGWARGTYMVVVRTAEGSQTRRLVVE